MYEHFTIQEQIDGAELVANRLIKRYGVSVYVDSDPDWVSPDFIIDPLDIEGLAIFRKFAGDFAAHLKTLKIKP